MTSARSHPDPGPGSPTGRHPLWFRFLEGILRLFYPRHAVPGLERVDRSRPAVFVCNHAETYGPIVMTLRFPLPFRPWVHGSLASRERCLEHLEMDFTRRLLRLRPPASRWLAALITPVCMGLMRQIGAIPVFRGEMAIRDTFRMSLDTLRAGHSLVIFPEARERPHSEQLRDFRIGFAHLAWLYGGETGQALRFHPVWIDRKARQIVIGSALEMDPAERNPRLARERLARALRDAVQGIASKCDPGKPDCGIASKGDP